MASSAKRPPPRRVQYAALPWRRIDSATEVMLITSRGSGRWIIPKGWPMKRRPPHSTAAREALEEAGVLGQIGKTAIGTFSHRKALKEGRAVICEVEVFPLEVTRQRKTWPEKGKRKVQWFSPSDAAKAVRQPLLGAIIRGLQKKS